jgi:hypothetical protein
MSSRVSRALERPRPNGSTHAVAPLGSAGMAAPTDSGVDVAALAAELARKYPRRFTQAQAYEVLEGLLAGDFARPRITLYLPILLFREALTRTPEPPR